MRLREWPPRRIGLMWLIVIGAQVLAMAVAPLLLGWEYAGFRDDSVLLPDAPNSFPVPVSAPDSTASAFTVTRTALASGDTLIRIERGGSFMEFRSSGGTVRMSEDVERGAAVIGGAFAAGVQQVVLLVGLVLGILGIPVVILLAITITWTLQRRRDQRIRTAPLN